MKMTKLDFHDYMQALFVVLASAAIIFAVVYVGR